jgi:hypothetical protein
MCEAQESHGADSVWQDGRVTDVFVSYSRDDEELARELVGQLRHRGLSVFLDLDSVHVGTPWAEALAFGIAGSAAVVFILPQKAMTSPWLSFEFIAAVAGSLKGRQLLFPVVRHNTPVPKGIEGFQSLVVDGPEDLPKVAEVVAGSVAIKKKEASEAKRRRDSNTRMSFLAALAHSDIDRSPAAVAIVIDEITRQKPRAGVSQSEVIELLKEGLSLGVRTLGPNHSSVMAMEGRLGEDLVRAGRFDEAVSVLTAVAEGLSTTSPKDPAVVTMHLNLAHALEGAGSLLEAESVYRRAVGLANPDTQPSALAAALVGLGRLLVQRGDLSEGRAVYERALRANSVGTDKTWTVSAMAGLSEVEAALQNQQACESWGIQAYQTALAALGPDHPQTRELRHRWAHGAWSK